VTWGDAADFRDICLAVITEYSWHVLDNNDSGEARNCMKILRDAHDTVGGTRHNSHYQDIYGKGSDSLGHKIHAFLVAAQPHGSPQGLLDALPNSFIPQFSQLLDILDGHLPSKQLWDSAVTSKYPRRNLFPPAAQRCNCLRGKHYVLRLAIADRRDSTLKPEADARVCVRHPSNGQHPRPAVKLGSLPLQGNGSTKRLVSTWEPQSNNQTSSWGGSNVCLRHVVGEQRDKIYDDDDQHDDQHYD